MWGWAEEQLWQAVYLLQVSVFWLTKIQNRKANIKQPEQPKLRPFERDKSAKDVPPEISDEELQWLKQSNRGAGGIG